MLVAARSGTTGRIVGCLIIATVVTVLVISGGTLSKLVALRAGGVAVAQSVGAVPVDPSTRDPQLRRFINVVEEMSIASGVPAPRLFVLESEDGINAFAAGYTPADAAVTVTAGALHQLNRDELQGVIGHEFSHVLNGDMRLNLRLIGLLNGILLLGLVGLRILQFGGGRGRDATAGRADPGRSRIAALVLGFVGQFFAGLIKAAVSRQREWLADASSVQFTRQSSGLVGALKKIAGVPAGSALHDAPASGRSTTCSSARASARSASCGPRIRRCSSASRRSNPASTPTPCARCRSSTATRSPNGMAEDAQLGLVGSALAGPGAARAGDAERGRRSGRHVRAATIWPAVRLCRRSSTPRCGSWPRSPARPCRSCSRCCSIRPPPVRDRQLALIADQVWPG